MQNCRHSVYMNANNVWVNITKIFSYETKACLKLIISNFINVYSYVLFVEILNDEFLDKDIHYGILNQVHMLYVIYIHIHWRNFLENMNIYYSNYDISKRN